MEHTLTIHRAKEIVSHAEDEFSSGHRIEYSFTPFKDAGASTPLEAYQAILITIADFFQFVKIEKIGNPDAMKLFNEYAKASGFIAMRLFAESTKIHSIARLLEPRVIEGLIQAETIESFVSYLHTTNVTEPEFWTHVYERIGVSFPIETAKRQTDPMLKQWNLRRIFGNGFKVTAVLLGFLCAVLFGDDALFDGRLPLLAIAGMGVAAVVFWFGDRLNPQR